MSHANAALITRFYEAFQQLNAETMNACYAGDAVFSDPVCGELRGTEIGDMWRMLTSRAQGFSVAFDNVQANDETGSANWVARYVFSRNGREIVNRVQAHFRFRDGLIAGHRDRFDMWTWSRQALGIKGTLLGWTPLVRNAIHHQATRELERYRSKAVNQASY